MKPSTSEGMPITKDVPWKCPSCGFLLGVVSADRITLRIKYKDFYVMIAGKDVKVTELCRKCATLVELESNQMSGDPVPSNPKSS